MTGAWVVGSALFFAVFIHAAAAYSSGRLVFLLTKSDEDFDKFLSAPFRVHIGRLNMLLVILLALFLLAGSWIAAGMDASFTAAARAGIGPKKDAPLDVLLFVLAVFIFLFIINNSLFLYLRRSLLQRRQKTRNLQVGFLVASALTTVVYFHMFTFLISRT